ncbi:ArnT family glycosyltransferase [Leifsonia xyli]|uniref:ArnT family glycosyltransferase n=1 Tax=Leifsonia xyli TaxID=1575 RepID=UPI003D6677B8
MTTEAKAVPRARSGSRPWPERAAVRWGLLAVVFAWGAYQALWNILAANPNADEPEYVAVGRDYVAGDVTLNHEQPPTAKYLFGAVQLLFGDGPVAPRILVGVLTILGGVIVFLWLRPELGWVPALVPTAFWLLLPRGVDTTFEFRLDRFAVLEPVMVFFAIGAMAAAWQWHRGRSIWWLVVAGAGMGLSATSKPTTAVILPAFLVLIVGRRRLRPILFGLIVPAVAAAATVFLVYRPIGLRTGIADLLDFQVAQNASGHLIDLAGFATGHPRGGRTSTSPGRDSVPSPPWCWSRAPSPPASTAGIASWSSTWASPSQR